MMQELGFDFWIGLRKITSDVWGWTDNSQNDYINWKPSYPDYYNVRDFKLC